MSETTIPAWLNLDAFDLPADHIATVNEVSDELVALLQRLVPLLERAKQADKAIEKGIEGRHDSDDVMDLLFAYTGRKRLWEVLGIMQSLAEDITESTGLVGPRLVEACEEYGVEVTFDHPVPS